MLREHLADQENLVAPSLDRFSHKFFGMTVGVHFSSIDQTHAELDAETQRGDLLGPPVRVFADVPCTLSEHGNGFTRWKTDGANRGGYDHGMLLRRMRPRFFRADHDQGPWTSRAVQR